MQGEQCWECSFPKAATAALVSWKGGWKPRPAQASTRRARADSTEQELIPIIMQMSRHARSVTLGYLHTPPSLSLAGTGAAAAHQLLGECGAGSAPASATGRAGWDIPATLIPPGAGESCSQQHWGHLSQSIPELLTSNSDSLFRLGAKNNLLLMVLMRKIHGIIITSSLHPPLNFHSQSVLHPIPLPSCSHYVIR